MSPKLYDTLKSDNINEILATRRVFLADRYRLKKRIGGGSFGIVFFATDNQDGSDVAVKVESKKIKSPQLVHEKQLYSVTLNDSQGFPRIFNYIDEHDCTALIMELLGPSLEELFQLCDRKFTLRTVLLLGYQMLRRIESLHLKVHIHRDIKPDNFVMGLGKYHHKVYLIDMGLVKKYVDTVTRMHIPYREGKKLTGTARYASINAHKGFELSRRDDLESLNYVLLYFLRGSLPWQGLKGTTKKEKYERIAEMKMKTTVEELCDGFPDEFSILLNYTRRLDFTEDPDYDYCFRLLKDLMNEHGINRRDSLYDWRLKNFMKTRSSVA